MPHTTRTPRRGGESMLVERAVAHRRAPKPPGERLKCTSRGYEGIRDAVIHRMRAATG
jgi:hypothetical protein